MKDQTVINVLLQSLPGVPGVLSICLELLVVYNLRSAEILSAKWSDFKPPKLLYLRGCKGSNDIVIRDREILQHINKLPRLHPDLIFYPITYSMLYHHIKKNYSHLFDNRFTKKNKKVTHYFRYSAASQFETAREVTTVLHHASKGSASFYNKNLKEVKSWR